MLAAKELDVEQQVSYALLRIYLTQLPLLMLGYLANVSLVIYVSWEPVGRHELMTLWAALNIIMVSIVLLIAWSFKKNELRFRSAVWIRILTLCTLVFGFLWGAVPGLFMDVTDSHNLVTICILILGVLSAAAYSLSIVPPLFYLFFTPALSIFTYMVYAEGLYIVAIATVSFFIFLAWMSHQIFRMMHDVYMVRFQNELMTHSLREEKELVEKASRAKTRFLAAASHDLRQPLQAQRFFIEAINVRSQNSELSELSAQVLDSQRAMQSMLDALLDISRLDAGVVESKPAVVSLNDLFSRLVYDLSPLAENKGLHFAVRWPPQNTLVHCDLGLVESICRNLISNAIRYTDHGTVMLAVRRRNAYWRLEVRDSGVGIAKDQQQEIFEEFRQLGNSERDRSRGLGLGLSIVRRLCQLLDYPLTLYSQPDKGSVFAFQLPVRPDAAVLINNSVQDVDMNQLQGLDVLIIDDEWAIREGLCKSLRAYGLRVRAAAHRDEALSMVNERVPDVMSVDYRLPDHDTGGAVIMAIREHIGKEIPAVLLTGDTAPERLQELQTTHCPILHKPVSMQELLLAIQQVVRSD